MSGWIIETAVSIYTFLWPFAGFAFAIAVLVLLPLAAWRKTRGAAGIGLFALSYIFGATAWFLGLALTFGSFGWFGVVIGLFIFGLGVVPVGIIGAFLSLGLYNLGVTLCLLLVITLATRMGGMACAHSFDRYRVSLQEAAD